MNDLYSVENLTRFAMRWNLKERFLVGSMAVALLLILFFRFVPMPKARMLVAATDPIVITQYVQVVETQYVTQPGLVVTNIFNEFLRITNLSVSTLYVTNYSGGGYATNIWIHSTNLSFR